MHSDIKVLSVPVGLEAQWLETITAIRLKVGCVCVCLYVYVCV